MTTVNVGTTKNTVTVNGETRVVTVKTGETRVVTVKVAGPQGPGFSDGNKGDVTIANNGASITINSGAVTSTKLANSGVTSGSYGSGSAIPTITVNDKGIVTAISTNSVNTTTNLSTTTSTTDVTIASSTGSNASISEASGSAAGVMSVAHHDKLDGIESNATADQTAAEIKTLLNSNGIVNAQVDASAAIAGSKIQPTFAQNIIINTVFPQVWLNDTNSNSDYKIINANGTFKINDSTNSADRFTIASDGSATFTGNVSISQAVPRLNFIDTGDNPNYQINNTNGVFKILDSSTPADRITIATDGTVTVTGNLNANAGLDVTGGDITGVLGSAVTGTTQSASDNSTKIATTAYTDTAIANLVSSAPSTLDTLNELAAALGDDPNFATTVTNSIATKLPLSGGTLTGDLTISTTAPLIKFDETDQTTDYFIVANNNTLTLARNNLNSPNHIQKWNADGTVDFLTNVDFASGIDVTGDLTVTTGALTITSTLPQINLTDSDNSDWYVANNNGTFRVRNTTNSVDGLMITSSGQVDFAGNVDCNSGLDVTGEITGTSHLDLPSDAVLKLGNSDEFQIFHNSPNGNSIIKEIGGGGLSIQSNGNFINFWDSSNSRFFAQFNTNGACQFRHGADIRLATSSTGVDVTGGVTWSAQSNVTGTIDFAADTLATYTPTKTGSGTGTATNVAISLRRGHVIAAQHDGHIRHLFHQATNGKIIIGQNNTGLIGDIQLLPGNSGTVQLFYDGQTNTTPKLATTATGVDVNGILGVSATGANASNAAIKANVTGSANHIHAAQFFAPNISSGQNVQIYFGKETGNNKTASMGYKYYSDGSDDNLITFSMWGANDLVTINGQGNTTITGNLAVDTDTLFVDSANDKVGINQASPTYQLDLVGTQRNTVSAADTDILILNANMGTNNNRSLVFKSPASDSGSEPFTIATGNSLEVDIDNSRTLFIDDNGQINLHHDGANTPKLNTIANGVKVHGNIGIGTSTPNRSLHIVSNGTSRIALTDNDITAETDSLVGGIDFTTLDQSTTTGTSAHIGAYHQDDQGNAYLRFDTGNASNVTERMRIKSDGAVELTETLKLQNNKNLNLGGSNNLVLKFDGSVARILADSQPMYLKGLDGSATQAGITMYKGNSAEKMFEAFNDGAVKLYFDGGTYGTAKLETTASGITVDGNVRLAKGDQFDFGDQFRILKYTGSDTMTLQSPEDVVICIDNNANGSTNHKFAILKETMNPDNGTGTELFKVEETGNVTIAGDVVATGDGTFDDLRIGEWTGSADYGGVFHKNHSGNEYMMISTGSSTSGHTYISATTGMNVVIRGGNNSNTNQIEVQPTGGINLTAANGVNILDGNIDFGSNADNNPVISMKGDNNRVKYRVFTNTDFGTGFSGNITHGGLNGFCMTFQVSDTANRGWLFLDSGHGLNQGAMALTSEGKMNLAHSLRLGYGESDTTTPGATHALDVSGSANITGTVNSVDLSTYQADGSSYLRSNATDTFENGTLNIRTNSNSGQYWGFNVHYVTANTQWEYLQTGNYGFAFRNSGADGFHIKVASAAGVAGAVPAYKDFKFNIDGKLNVPGHVVLDSFKNFIAAADSNDNKFDFFGGNGTYAMGMSNGWSYGGLNGWSMNFHFNNNNSWGWAFKDSAHSKAQGAMALTTEGKMTVAHSIRLGYGESDTTTPGATYALDVSGDANITGTLEAKAIRFGDSHVKRISVDYRGELTGTSIQPYLEDNEFQEILTITPSTASQNYSVIGRIIAASGANVHTIDINLGLRSNTLPNLQVSGSYISTIIGSHEFLTPRFWLKTTSTGANDPAAFKLVVEINEQIFGRVTADLEIIARSEADLNNIVVNEDDTSEVLNIPSDYAQTTPTKVYETDDGAFSFDGNLTVGGFIDLSTSSNPLINMKTNGTRDKYRLWSGTSAYAIGFDNAMSFGGLNDYATTFQMNSESDRGWVFLDTSHSDAQGAMALTTEGKMTVAHSLRLGYGDSDTTTPAATVNANAENGPIGGNYSLDVSGKMRVIGGTLGTTAGDQLELAYFKSIPNSNRSHLSIFQQRDTDGTDWTSAYTRIQQFIDVTPMGYIQFNGTDNTNGMEFGRGPGGTKFIFCDFGGPVKLYHDGVERFSTDTTGANVLNGSLGTNDQIYMKIGRNEAANNTAIIGFKYSGTSGSNDNKTIIGVHGNRELLTVSTNGIALARNTTVNGTVTCTSLTETSDIALKENIQPLSNVLDKVKQLTGYKYNFKNKEKPSMGVIAQDVEKVFPELVHGEEGKKSLQYSGLVGALIEAVKELSAKVAVLESK